MCYLKSIEKRAKSVLIAYMVIIASLCLDTALATHNDFCDYKLAPNSRYEHRWRRYFSSHKEHFDERLNDGFVYALFKLDAEIDRILRSHQKRNTPVVSGGLRTCHLSRSLARDIKKVIGSLNPEILEDTRGEIMIGEEISWRLLKLKRPIFGYEYIYIPCLTLQVGSRNVQVAFNIELDEMSDESLKQLGIEEKDYGWLEIGNMWITSHDLIELQPNAIAGYNPHKPVYWYQRFLVLKGFLAESRLEAERKSRIMAMMQNVNSLAGLYEKWPNVYAEIEAEFPEPEQRNGFIAEFNERVDGRIEKIGAGFGGEFRKKSILDTWTGPDGVVTLQAISVLDFIDEYFKKNNHRKLLIIQNVTNGLVYPPFSYFSNNMKKKLGIFEPTLQDIVSYCSGGTDDRFDQARVIVVSLKMSHAPSYHCWEINKWRHIAALMLKTERDIFFIDSVQSRNNELSGLAEGFPWKLKGVDFKGFEVINSLSFVTSRLQKRKKRERNIYRVIPSIPLSGEQLQALLDNFATMFPPRRGGHAYDMDEQMQYEKIVRLLGDAAPALGMALLNNHHPYILPTHSYFKISKDGKLTTAAEDFMRRFARSVEIGYNNQGVPKAEVIKLVANLEIFRSL